MQPANIRVGKPTPSGAKIVFSDHESWLVYRPSDTHQLLLGHLDGKWYFRNISYYGCRPMSNAYDTEAECLEALSATVAALESTPLLYA